MSDTMLFRTPHGSHLYGLAHAGSDCDWYEVHEKVPHERARWSRQRIAGDDDLYVADLGTWITDCTKGVPQALEAMWSQIPTVDRIAGLRAGFRVGTAVVPTYLRTIRHFVEAGDSKRRVHAFRLALNVATLAQYGRFDPTLTPGQVALVRALGATVPRSVAAAEAETITIGADPADVLRYWRARR